MKYAIGIPTLNRADLLNPSLLMYSNEYSCDIHVINNGIRNILTPPKVSVHNNERNIGVAASWNMLCDIIFKNNDHAIILNDDIHLGVAESDIRLLIKDMPNCFIRSTQDWCAFVLPKTVYEKVGKFDECFFPAYYEDKSYEYRMKLKGIRQIQTPNLNPFVYRSSQTLEMCPEIMELSKKNRDIYIQMWGGEPKCEKFIHPFNKKQ